MIKRIDLETCGSTNDEAWLQLAEANTANSDGTIDGYIVSSRSQEKGRGRQGRTWISSSRENLFASFGIPSHRLPLQDPNLFSWIPLIAGVSALEVLFSEIETSPFLRLKWPNDLMFGNKKWGGILCESRFSGARCSGIVIGMGLNLHAHPNLEAGENNAASTALAQELKIPGHLRDLILDHWPKKVLEYIEKLPTAAGQKDIQDRWTKFARLDLYSQLRTHTKESTKEEATALELTSRATLRVKLHSTNQVIELNQAE